MKRGRLVDWLRLEVNGMKSLEILLLARVVFLRRAGEIEIREADMAAVPDRKKLTRLRRTIPSLKHCKLTNRTRTATSTATVRMKCDTYREKSRVMMVQW